MITVPLELRHRASVIHQTVALVLPGNDPAAWLDIILSLTIPAEKLRLYLVPAGRNSGNPGGLLVIFPSARGAASPGPGLPLGKLGAGLFLPVDAELYPPVSPEELTALCRYPVMLFHPGLGLVGFEAKDEKKVGNLFSRPIYQEGNWNFASPGVHLNQHIRSVSLLALTDPSQLFGEASEEIGSDPIQQLPPNPAEPSQGKASEFRRGLEKFIAAAIAATTSKFPHTGQQRTWINDLEDWAAKRLQGISREQEELRHKELHRLLRKLDEEPDDGLRHAIPMSSFANRGIAHPSNRLGSRETNFSLGGIRGGGPVDPWAVPSDIQAQLSKRYRELAQRELKLGRYRRAAFIYAELLGDLHSAASALKQGRFYQEAAVVYRDHLKQPREAAFCLAEGGLIREAIEIYRGEKMFIEAARLYRRAGQLEEAEIEFRKAIDAKLAAGDRLAAVSFLERELGQYDEALQVLEEGWPNTSQAIACFTGFIERLGSRGEHQRAIRKAGEARSLVLGNELYLPVSVALADLALRYPDASARVAFGDTVRLMAATALSDKPPIESAKAMLQILYRLSPQDRLLVRDGNRFLLGEKEKQRAKDKIKALPPPIPGHQSIVLITSFTLPSSPRITVIESVSSHYFAAGVQGRDVLAIRGTWDGQFQQTGWKDVIFDNPSRLWMATMDLGRPEMLLGLFPGLVLNYQMFPVSNLFFSQPAGAGSPPWMPGFVMAAAASSDMVWIMRAEQREILLQCHQPRGEIISTQDITESLGLELLGNTLPEPIIAAHRNFVIIGFHRRIIVVHSGQPPTKIDLDGEVVGLVAAPPFARGCIAIVMEQGIRLFWGRTGITMGIAEEIQFPTACFVRSGSLVVVGKNEGLILQIDTTGVKKQSRFTWKGTPQKVIPGAEPNQFAILTTDQKIQLFAIR